MTETVYFQNPETPDKLYEIVKVEKGTSKVTVRDHEQHEFVLDLNLLRLLHWRMVKKE
jgi:hypothetical protein